MHVSSPGASVAPPADASPSSRSLTSRSRLSTHGRDPSGRLPRVHMRNRSSFLKQHQTTPPTKNLHRSPRQTISDMIHLVARPRTAPHKQLTPPASTSFLIYSVETRSRSVCATSFSHTFAPNATKIRRLHPRGRATTEPTLYAALVLATLHITSTLNHTPSSTPAPSRLHHLGTHESTTISSSTRTMPYAASQHLRTDDGSYLTLDHPRTFIQLSRTSSTRGPRWALAPLGSIVECILSRPLCSDKKTSVSFQISWIKVFLLRT